MQSLEIYYIRFENDLRAGQIKHNWIQTVFGKIGIQNGHNTEYYSFDTEHKCHSPNVVQVEFMTPIICIDIKFYDSVVFI